MSVSVHHFESKPYKAAIGVIERLKGNGHIAYLAGGCVRDLLLGVEPNDFDVATDARPSEIGSYFQKTASVGAAFGVMLVRDFGETIEVATFRSDGVYSDARRPDSVAFSSPSEDAQRRDFTINALFLDPFAQSGHQVIDFVRGMDDVRDRVLRAVGLPEDRLREDHLRALRAVRFASKYDLVIETRTSEAIGQHARALCGVSIERIGEEIRKMLMHPSRVRACRLIDELDLDDAIFGDVHPFNATPMESLERDAPYPVALVALAIGRGHQIADEPGVLCAQYRRSLDLSNADLGAMRSILECMRAFDGRWGKLGIAGKKRLASQGWADQALAIYRALHAQRACAIQDQVRLLESEHGGVCPKPLVSGADLIELGYKPGPEFKDILDAVYDEQLEGRVQTQQQAIDFVQRQVR